MRGFTLIETLVVVIVTILILSFISGFAINSYRTHNYIIKQSKSLEQARKTIEDITKELRKADTGDNGSFLIEKAEDYEIIFYSDIDKDGSKERVRYFIKPAGGKTGYLVEDCVSFLKGGTCQVGFSNFLTNNLKSAQIKVSAEGDLGDANKSIDILADGRKLGTICSGKTCGKCSSLWEGATTFDVTEEASDGVITLSAAASQKVSPICDWKEPDHSFKAKFEFSWVEEASPDAKSVFKKGIIQPEGWPIKYPSDKEVLITISENIANEDEKKPIFTYYNKDWPGEAFCKDNPDSMRCKNNPLISPINIEDIAFVKILLIVNPDPSKHAQNREFISGVSIRNIKSNL